MVVNCFNCLKKLEGAGNGLNLAGNFKWDGLITFLTVSCLQKMWYHCPGSNVEGRVANFGIFLDIFEYLRFGWFFPF